MTYMYSAIAVIMLRFLHIVPVSSLACCVEGTKKHSYITKSPAIKEENVSLVQLSLCAGALCECGVTLLQAKIKSVCGCRSVIYKRVAALDVEERIPLMRFTNSV